MAERLICNQRGGGSMPSASSKIRPDGTVWNVRFPVTEEVAGSNPARGAKILRGGAAVARRSHKPQVAGSIPVPASNLYSGCSLAR